MIGSLIGIIASSGAAAGGVPVSGYSLWLDASDTTTFTFSSGSRVSEWRDKSGNAYHMTQATAAYQPDRNATQNSLSAVKMRVSTAKYFMRNTSYNWANSAFTMLCVIRPRTGEYTAYLSQDATAHLQLGQDPNSPSNMAISKISQATAASNLTLADNTTGQITYKSAGVSSGSVTVQIYKSKVAASSTVTLSSLSTQAVTMIGGSRSDLAPSIGDFFGDGGYLCELLVYPSQLNDTDRNQVEDYLIAKWGL
jgi:hypothetical protein